MRIGVYFPTFDPQPAGLGRYTVEVVGRLLQDFDVVLYTETPEHVPPDWSVTTHAMPKRSGGGLGHLMMRQSWLQLRLPYHLQRSAAEALFVPFHEGLLRPPVPQVVVVHDLTPLVVPSAYFHPLAKLHLRGVLPWILRRSMAVAVSNNTRRDMIERLRAHPDRISVVGEGFEQEIFRPSDEATIGSVRRRHSLSKPYLFYSGTYASHKNVAFLVDVLSGCRRRGMDITLALAGRQDTGEFEAVRASAQRQGVAESVVSLGYVPRAHLSPLMQGATAFVFPSLYEGYGLAPLEAMASGAVVLSSDRASLSEVVGDGGILLDPQTPKDWVDRVGEMLDDERSTSQLRSRALRRASLFDWNRTANEIGALLRGARASG